MPDWYLDMEDVPPENQKEYILTVLEMNAAGVQEMMKGMNQARNTMNSKAMKDWRVFEYIVCRLNRDLEDLLREIQYAREG